MIKNYLKLRFSIFLFSFIICGCNNYSGKWTLPSSVCEEKKATSPNNWETTKIEWKQESLVIHMGIVYDVSGKSGVMQKPIYYRLSVEKPSAGSSRVLNEIAIPLGVVDDNVIKSDPHKIIVFFNNSFSVNTHKGKIMYVK